MLCMLCMLCVTSPARKAGTVGLYPRHASVAAAAAASLRTACPCPALPCPALPSPPLLLPLLPLLLLLACCSGATPDFPGLLKYSLKLTANIRPLSPTRVTFPEQRAKVRCACGMQGWAGWSPGGRAAAVADPPAGVTALVMQGPLPAGLLPSCLPNHSLLAHLAAVPCRATRAAQRCWMQCWGAGPWCASVSRSGGGGLAWAGMGWHGLAWAGMGRHGLAWAACAWQLCSVWACN